MTWWSNAAKPAGAVVPCIDWVHQLGTPTPDQIFPPCSGPTPPKAKPTVHLPTVRSILPFLFKQNRNKYNWQEHSMHRRVTRLTDSACEFRSHESADNVITAMSSWLAHMLSIRPWLSYRAMCGVRSVSCAWPKKHKKKSFVRLTDKPWLKVPLADLLWEKNPVRSLKKYDLQANMASLSLGVPTAP